MKIEHVLIGVLFIISFSLKSRIDSLKKHLDDLEKNQAEIRNLWIEDIYDHMKEIREELLYCNQEHEVKRLMRKVFRE